MKVYIYHTDVPFSLVPTNQATDILKAVRYQLTAYLWARFGIQTLLQHFAFEKYLRDVFRI